MLRKELKCATGELVYKVSDDSDAYENTVINIGKRKCVGGLAYLGVNVPIFDGDDDNWDTFESLVKDEESYFITKDEAIKHALIMLARLCIVEDWKDVSADTINRVRALLNE